MYTAKELIESLKECPPDYQIAIMEPYDEPESFPVQQVGINHSDKTFTLFT